MKRYFLYLIPFGLLKAVETLVVLKASTRRAIAMTGDNPVAIPEAAWQFHHSVMVFYGPSLALLAGLFLWSLRKRPLSKALLAPFLSFLTIEALALLIILLVCFVGVMCLS